MPKTIVEFDIFRPFADRLVHGTTTKAMGSFRGAENGQTPQLEKLKEAAGNDPLFAVQIHGDQILNVGQRPEERPEGDALITTQKNLPIGIKVADCQGILIYDPKRNAIAAVHSGWRGSALNILGKTVLRMKDEFGSDPADLLAGIAPSIGPCCFEFSDPKKELPAAMYPFLIGNRLDFWTLSVHQLSEAGVQSIELKAECTKCHSDRYFSHRNGDTGRMAVFIGLK